MSTLIEMLREFATGDDGEIDPAYADLLALAERFEAGTIIEVEGEGPAVMTWPDDVEPMTDDELVALADGLTGLADVDEAGPGLLVAAGDIVVQVNGEIDSREQLAADEQAATDAARERLRNGGVEPGAESDTPSDSDDTDGDDDGDEETDGDGGEGDEATETAGSEPEPVLAGAGRRAPLSSLARRSAGSARNAAPVTAAATDGHNPITWAAGVAPPVLARGEQPGTAQIDAAISQRLADIAGSGAIVGREKVRVATTHGTFAPERRLVDAAGRFVGSERATEIVMAALDQGTRQATTQVAAGGFCAPPVPIYTVMTMGSAVRPIRDSALSPFQATRGRVIQLNPPRLQALAGSAGVWTEADDIAAVSDPDLVKNILRIECDEPLESEVQAITSSLIYGNMLARSYGEWVAAWTQLARVRHAQVAEVELFDALVALATPVNAEPTTLSATRDFVNYMARLAWHVRRRNRELRSFPFRLVTSETVLDIVAEDLAVSAHGESNEENLVRAETVLTAALAARGINVTWSPDLDVPGAQGDDTEAANYPTAVPYVLYPEGWAIHLDAGTEDAGVIRDSTLIRQNDVMTFMETFEGVHRLGAKSDARTGSITLCPNGAVYGFSDPDGRCASYT